MLMELWPLAAKHGVKFVLNAGGLNPEGARAVIARAFRDKGWRATLATVTGDAVLERFDELGAARSLRMDNLGKAVAAQLLRMEIEAPVDLPRLKSK
jgi:protein-disulfide isomerase-like protein with CxxC motif